MKISVVITCYRDEGSIREMHRRLQEVLPPITADFEIIFVNDASPDHSEEILRELSAADPRLVVVNHTRNFGSQNAFVSGMKVSRGDCVILMDGDLQDPPRVIPEFIAKWREGFAIVYGDRVTRQETLFRRCAYKMFYRIFRFLADFSIPADAGDFGLLDRQVVNVLLNDFPERLVYLRGLRAYTGYRSIGVPYAREARFAGSSTNSLLRNAEWAGFAIFSFSKKPLHYISVLAFLSVFVTLAMTVYYLATYFVQAKAPSGWMTEVMLILFFGSVQLVSIAVLAEYMAHMYEELKGRPRYVVREIWDRRKQIL